MHLKLEIARRQLGTALWLFLEDQDPVSVHCLACGGGELAHRFASAAGNEAWLDAAILHNPATRLNELLRHRNRFWNAMKHATGHDGKPRSDEELLAQFDDQENDELLFIAFYDFAIAYGSLPLEAQIFQYWFLARYPWVIGPSEPQSDADIMFPGVEAMPRHKAKARLRGVIKRYRKASSVMAHARTDRRQLVLGRRTHPLGGPFSTRDERTAIH